MYIILSTYHGDTYVDERMGENREKGKEYYSNLYNPLNALLFLLQIPILQFPHVHLLGWNFCTIPPNALLSPYLGHIKMCALPPSWQFLLDVSSLCADFSAGFSPYQWVDNLDSPHHLHLLWHYLTTLLQTLILQSPHWDATQIPPMTVQLLPVPLLVHLHLPSATPMMVGILLHPFPYYPIGCACFSLSLFSPGLLALHTNQQSTWCFLPPMMHTFIL